MLKVLLLSTDVNVKNLVVDMLAIMQSDLFDLSHEESHARAMEVLVNEPVEVCLIDLEEDDGRINGSLEFLRDLRKDNIHTPVIFLANSPNREFDLAAMKLGAIDYLIKPYLQPQAFERALRYATERGRFLVEMSRQYQNIQDMEELKSDLVRIAAHDLKNPVSAVLLSSDMMMRYDLTEDQQRNHVQRIWHSARMMQRIITEILSAENIEQIIEGRTSNVLLRELVHTAIEDYQPLLDAKSLSLTTDIPDQTIQINADMVQLQRAVSLFLHNAIKYTPTGGSISIRVRSDDRTGSLEIEDTGYGVPDELQSRLFQPFFRAQVPETANIEGNGLGLYLAKRIITRYGGKIRFSSIYGQGSIFGFELPVQGQTAVG